MLPNNNSTNTSNVKKNENTDNNTNLPHQQQVYSPSSSISSSSLTQHPLAWSSSLIIHNVISNLQKVTGGTTDLLNNTTTTKNNVVKTPSPVVIASGAANMLPPPPLRTKSKMMIDTASSSTALPRKQQLQQKDVVTILNTHDKTPVATTNNTNNNDDDDDDHCQQPVTRHETTTTTTEQTIASASPTATVFDNKRNNNQYQQHSATSATSASNVSTSLLASTTSIFHAAPSWKTKHYGGFYVPLLKLGKGSWGVAYLVCWKPNPAPSTDSANDREETTEKPDTASPCAPLPLDARGFPEGPESSKHLLSSKRQVIPPTTQNNNNQLGDASASTFTTTSPRPKHTDQRQQQQQKLDHRKALEQSILKAHKNAIIPVYEESALVRETYANSAALLAAQVVGKSPSLLSRTPSKNRTSSMGATNSLLSPTQQQQQQTQQRQQTSLKEQKVDTNNNNKSSDVVEFDDGPSGCVSSLSCKYPTINIHGHTFPREAIFVCKVERDWESPSIQREVKKAEKLKRRKERESQRISRLQDRQLRQQQQHQRQGENDDSFKVISSCSSSSASSSSSPESSNQNGRRGTSSASSRARSSSAPTDHPSPTYSETDEIDAMIASCDVSGRVNGVANIKRAPSSSPSSFSSPQRNRFSESNTGGKTSFNNSRTASKSKNNKIPDLENVILTAETSQPQPQQSRQQISIANSALKVKRAVTARGDIHLASQAETSSRRSQSNVDSATDSENTRISRIAGFEQSRRMKNEAGILRNIGHPNIVSFVDSFIKGESSYLILEFVDGGDLEQEIERRKPSQSNNYHTRLFTIESCLFIWVQIVLAVEYLHRHNIIHRDIKPANILVSKRWLCKLSDFGTAEQFSRDTNAAVSHANKGSPLYLPPECFLCDSVTNTKVPHSEALDVWGLGVILWELVNVTGPPFRGSTVASVANRIVAEPPKPMEREGVPKDVMDLLYWILQKNPDKRPSCKDILRTKIAQEAMDLYVKRVKSFCDGEGATSIGQIWYKTLLNHRKLIVASSGVPMAVVVNDQTDQQHVQFPTARMKIDLSLVSSQMQRRALADRRKKRVAQKVINAMVMSPQPQLTTNTKDPEEKQGH